eukprot:1210173-Rhodomonas_salina.1
MQSNNVSGGQGPAVLDFRSSSIPALTPKCVETLRTPVPQGRHWMEECSWVYAPPLQESLNAPCNKRWTQDHPVPETVEDDKVHTIKVFLLLNERRGCRDGLGSTR